MHLQDSHIRDSHKIWVLGSIFQTSGDRQDPVKITAYTDIVPADNVRDILDVVFRKANQRMAKTL